MGSVGSSAKAPPPTHGTCGSTVTVVEVIPPLVRKSSVSYPSVCRESAVRQELPKMAHEHARSERRLSRRSINPTAPTQAQSKTCIVESTPGTTGGRAPGHSSTPNPACSTEDSEQAAARTHRDRLDFDSTTK